MSEITRLHTGPRMSQAVVHNGIVYLAGQVGKPGDNVTEQTKSCLAQVDALLAETGSDKTRILQTIVWLADMKDFAEMNAVWDAWVSSVTPPTRVCVEVRMAQPHYRIEALAIAATI